MTRATTASQRLKTVTCRDCGEPMQAGSNARLPQRCLECGIKAHIDNTLQLAGKSGPNYEKWRNGLRRFLEQA